MIPLLLALISITVDSKVDSVVVYPDQVLVVRTATVSVSGSGELVFTALPGGLNDNTVRLKAPGMQIGEVQVIRGYMDEPTQTVKKLEERVKALEDELQGLDDRAEILKAKEEFLKSIKLGTPELIARELQQGKVSAESWRSALSFMAGELGDVKQSLIGLKRNREDLSKQLDAARKEYNDARAAIENRKEVRVEYDASGGTYDVRLAYVIGHGASWAPYYELRARPEEDKVGFSYYCKLSQRTGEDWSRVRVVLSTSRPVLGLAAPTPYPWYLSLYEPVVTKKGLQSRAMVPGAAMEAGPQEAVYDEVSAVETGISLQYVIPGRVSLKSGEPAKKLMLRESELSAEYGYYTLPRSSAQAFLQGKLVNTTPFVLLEGSANTYVGDEYTGSTYLQSVAPGETTEVSFGVDERVKVSRELVKSFRSKSGLFSKTEKDQLVYKTVVQNYHPKPIEIEIVEQVPVSQHKDISVKINSIEPKWLERDENAGTYTWKPVLESGDKFEIEVDFTVSHPPLAGSGGHMQMEGLF
ncbi:MAG: mucoidy inhibitor MuiA family protein [candidate division WOR-3 bacterium]|nr:MAG: mucoidy inhibitor MuiA family protein [candidate division WOR-3 bacterium]